MAKGYHNPYIKQTGGRTKQIGGSLAGTQGTFMVPIEGTSNTISQPSNPVTVKLVSPSQQVVEQAKSELQIDKRGTKRKASKKSISSSKRRRKVKTSRGKKKAKSPKRSKKIRKLKGKKPRKNKTAKRSRKPKKTIKKPLQFRDIFSSNHGST